MYIVYIHTLGAKTFSGINFRVFRIFQSFSRKFLSLEILNYQKTVFPREIMDILKRETRKFFQNS